MGMLDGTEFSVHLWPPELWMLSLLENLRLPPCCLLACWVLSPQSLALCSSLNTVCSVSLVFQIVRYINKSLFDGLKLYYAAML